MTARPGAEGIAKTGESAAADVRTASAHAGGFKLCLSFAMTAMTGAKVLANSGDWRAGVARTASAYAKGRIQRSASLGAGIRDSLAAHARMASVHVDFDRRSCGSLGVEERLRKGAA